MRKSCCSNSQYPTQTSANTKQQLCSVRVSFMAIIHILMDSVLLMFIMEYVLGVEENIRLMIFKLATWTCAHMEHSISLSTESMLGWQVTQRMSCWHCFTVVDLGSLKTPTTSLCPHFSVAIGGLLSTGFSCGAFPISIYHRRRKKKRERELH